MQNYKKSCIFVVEMIKAEKITKRYGSLEVLKGVSLEVEKGEIVAIAGASGAGKSTLLQILGTLDTPTSGSLRFNGTDPFALSSDKLADFRNKHIGFVFQFHRLLPEFSLRENIAIPVMISGKSKREALHRADELAEYFGLSERRNHTPSQLSGGECQRTAVARALANNPDLIFADEPSGSLDTHNRNELHKLFFDLRRDLNQTFLIVTHDETFASLTDRIIRMADGTIIH